MAELLNPMQIEDGALAKRHFLDSLNPTNGAEDWRFALHEARSLVFKALKTSNYLTDVAGALKEDGAHMLALRHLCAPPISQDQFKLQCPVWSKSTEKGAKPVSAKQAAAVAQVLEAWRNRDLTAWVDEKRKPTGTEIRRTLLALSPLIASQRLATASRNRLARKQEQDVIELLERKGWMRLPSQLIDTRAAVPPKHFMHNTRFATTSANRPTTQEVDIACGLPNTNVLAMECKVTNDETNSVKRVNDVIKKATAWKIHWGNFVITAALLQGVIADKDVQRLRENNIHVFWSHRLDDFSAWLDARFQG